MFKRKPKVLVEEAYRDYTPRLAYGKFIKRYVNGVPRPYLEGLEKVIILNSEAFKERLPDEHTEYKGKKIPSWECKALYYPKLEDRQAWILLLTDNILDKWPTNAFELRFPPLRDLILCASIYHEIGHHIDAEIEPEEGDQEEIAEGWRKRLTRRYLWRKYWYLSPVVLIIVLLNKFLKLDEFEERMIAEAESEE